MSISLSLFLAACLTTRPVSQLVSQQFDSLTAVTQHTRVNYRLYWPSDTKMKRTDVPLIVWFHGYGERGHNNIDQLAWLELLVTRTATHGSVPYDFPAAILAVQSPTGWRGSTDAVVPSVRSPGSRTRRKIVDLQVPNPNNAVLTRHSNRDALRPVDLALADVLQNRAVDLERVVAIGISEGAVACWQYACTRPGRLAAMVCLGFPRDLPLTGPPRRQIPLWAFQSEGDGVERTAYLQWLAARVNAAGGAMRYTIVPAPGHDCWTAAFREHDAADWLLSQAGAGPSTSTQRGSAVLLRGAAIVILVGLLAWRCCTPCRPFGPGRRSR